MPLSKISYPYVEPLKITNATIESLFTNAQTFASPFIIQSNSPTATALIARGNSSSSTANLQEWQNSNGTIFAQVNLFGGFFTNDVISVGGINTSGIAQLLVNSQSPTRVGEIVRGHPAQTGNLVQWQNSAGAILGFVDSAGYLYSSLLRAPSFGPYFSLNADSIHIRSTSTVFPSFYIVGQTDQIANQIEYRNIGNTVLSGVNPVGQMFNGLSGPITTQVGGTPTATSGTGTTATITLTSASNLSVGDIVVVSGFVPTNYDTTSAGAVVTAVNNAGPFTVSYASSGTGAMGAAGTVRTPAQSSIIPRNAGTVGQIIRGRTSQSADLLQFRDISDNIIASFTSTGVLLLPAATTSLPSIRLPHGTAPTTPTNGDMWTTTSGLFVRINGTTVSPILNPMTSQLQSTLAWNATDAQGQIYLNGTTGNRIDFNQNGVAAPTFTTRSVGTKIVLYPNIQAAAVDYALGIESSNLWFSTPNSSTGFKWYGGQTNIATLTGAGALTLSSSITTGGALNLNYASPAIASNNASAASIFTSTVTGITIGSSTIRTTQFPADGTTTTGTASGGYMGMPQVSTAATRQFAATDAGKHIYVTATGQTLTIPAEGTVNFPVGTTIVVVNGSGVSTTITITTDTLRLANSALTGARTLASNGMCTLLKIATGPGIWIASGNGLT